MNTTMLKNQYNGFRLNDSLLSKLKFSGYIRLWTIDRRFFESADGEQTPYWILKDEFGARFSCFDRRLVETLCPTDRYIVSGDIKITKGGTFLNLSEATPLSGVDFVDASQSTTTEKEPDLQTEMPFQEEL